MLSLAPWCTRTINICKDDQTVLPKSDDQTFLPKSDIMQKPTMLQMWPIFGVHVVFLMAVIIVMGK